jgi:hypothetical protein
MTLLRELSELWDSYIWPHSASSLTVTNVGWVAMSIAASRQTPVSRSLYPRDQPSVLKGTTINGRLYTLVRDEALDSLNSMVFLQHLLPYVSDKWLVICDSSPVHKGHMRTFLAEVGAQYIH